MLTKYSWTDAKGNTISYTFENFQYGSEKGQRIKTLESSSGYKLVFNYDNKYRRLSSVVLNDRKTILSIDNKGHFIDAKGRAIGYEPKEREFIIWRHNGSRTEYSYTPSIYFGNRITEQRIYLPGATSPYRVVKYIRNRNEGPTKPIEVNDGISIKRYEFTDYGNTKKELHYDLSRRLLKQVDKTYYEFKSEVHRPYRYFPQTETTYYTRANGSLGSGATYEYAYDIWGNRTMVKEPYGTVVSTTYTTVGDKRNLPQVVTTTIKDPVHNTTQTKRTEYQYDSRGNVVKELELYNGKYLETSYTYDSYNNITSKTDAKGNKLCFNYNYNFLTGVYKPDGTVIAVYSYDFDLVRKTKAFDSKMNIYRYRYDEVGRLTKESFLNDDPKLAITRQITYNDAKNTVTIHYGNDTEGWQEGVITYHPLLGKPQLIQRRLNGSLVKIKEYVYDSNGRVIREINNLGQAIDYSYDALDRMTKMVLPNGATTNYQWDDRTLTTIDPNGNKKIQEHDLLDRLVKVKEFPDEYTTYETSYIYDTASNLVEVTNPRGAKTRYMYDNLGRLQRVDYPQDGSNPMAPESYEYDEVGNLIGKTGANGFKRMDYEFFAGYRLKQVVEPDGRVISNNYDNNDNLISQTWGMDSYTYEYDQRNRVTKLIAMLDGKRFEFGYQYDAFGRMTELRYPGKAEPVRYRYDELDRLQQIPGYVNGCQYDVNNKLLEMQLANGMRNQYSYDVNERIVKIGVNKINQNNSIAELLTLSYTYDNSGNITRMNGDYYEYDGLNRLIWSGNVPKVDVRVTPWGRGTAWYYDGAGNRTRQEIYTNGQLQEMEMLGYDLANRLWSKGNTTYQNDAAGARTNKYQDGVAWSYHYDGESRLLQVNKDGIPQIKNSYDPAGMRVKKEVNGKTNYTIYSGANPLMEYDPATGESTYYIYAGDRSIAEEKGGKKIFYHRDHLGSTRAMTGQMEGWLDCVSMMPGVTWRVLMSMMMVLSTVIWK
ncbi:MAG TPA: hypothetical protein PLZ08_01700 [Bacillota bacterium]|nr:hypothetical protein [Bacillota bacterium]HOL08643.1 hypothetical protein [Bacillota bacterium]HPO96655.1 hypothetical protein [Bacillota bacterium]